MDITPRQLLDNLEWQLHLATAAQAFGMADESEVAQFIGAVVELPETGHAVQYWASFRAAAQTIIDARPPRVMVDVDSLRRGDEAQRLQPQDAVSNYQVPADVLERVRLGRIEYLGD